VNQAMVIKLILNHYEWSTGQQISLGKCSIMYGARCNQEVQAEIKNILNYETKTFEEEYLGLPVPEGRMKKEKIKPIKERFQKRASDWSKRYMSSGAKETNKIGVASSSNLCNGCF
jgi:hypothetical protein